MGNDALQVLLLDGIVLINSLICDIRDKCQLFLFLAPRGFQLHILNLEWKKTEELTKRQKSGIYWPNILISPHSLILLSLTDPSAAP